jgi:hypothetical protein
MTEHISFLFGSGFSAPENIPTVGAINKRLRQLKEDEFYLGSDQRAFFYQTAWRDPNGWMPNSSIDRLFAQEFIAFYCKEVLHDDLDLFNYEVFYDYFSEFLRYQKHKDEIAKFCETFRTTYIKDSVWASDDHNFVWRFNKIFNQLISGLLTVPRYYEDISYSNYPTYDPLVGLMRELLKSKIVNVHTLNHDLFFDMLASKHSNLWQHFCDGFTEYGSPYFGEVSFDHKSELWTVHKSYKVRLRYYNNDYSKALRLYKLHGSIDNYILFKATTPGGSLYTRDNSVRVKKDFAVGEFLMERLDEKLQKYIYDRPFSENHPDFLTGTTEKIRLYNDPFYDNLFSIFKSNLLNSTHLIVIGYGFQDRGINEFLENHYLIFNKPMFIIDIKKPDSPLLEKYKDQITFFDKGATGVSYKEYMELVTRNNMTA